MAEQTVFDFDDIGPPGPSRSTGYDEVHDSVRAWLAGRQGSKRQSYRSSRAQTDHPVKPVEAMSLGERMVVIQRNHGFYPYSNLEANHGIRLQNELGTPASTAKYLATVLKRQKALADMDNHERSPMHIVNDFNNFAADARMASIVLGSFIRGIESVRPTLKLTEVGELPRDYSLPILRAYVVSEAVQHADLSPKPYENVGDVLEIDYIAGDLDGPLGEMLDDFTESTTVRDARLLAKDTIGQQALREAFWDARIAEAHNFVAVRPMVNFAQHGR